MIVGTYDVVACIYGWLCGFLWCFRLCIHWYLIDSSFWPTVGVVGAIVVILLYCFFLIFNHGIASIWCCIYSDAELCICMWSKSILHFSNAVVVVVFYFILFHTLLLINIDIRPWDGFTLCGFRWVNCCMRCFIYCFVINSLTPLCFHFLLFELSFFPFFTGLALFHSSGDGNDVLQIAS